MACTTALSEDGLARSLRYLGSARSMFQWRVLEANHWSSPRGISTNRVMTRCPPS